MKISPAGILSITLCYVILLAGIIFVADIKSTRYMLNFIGNIPYGDKIGHFFLMGIFSFLVNLTLKARRVYWILLGSLIVGSIVTLEEFSQIFVRGRSFDLSDLAADFTGILILGEAAALVCKRAGFTKQI